MWLVIIRFSHLIEMSLSGITILSAALAHFLEIFIQVLGPFARISANGTTRYPVSTIVDNLTGEPTGKSVPSVFPDHITITGVLKESGAWVTIVLRFSQPSVSGRTQLDWQIDGEDGVIKVEDNRPMGANISAHDPESISLNGERLPWNTDVDGEAFESPTPFLRNTWLEFLKGKEGGGNYLDIHDAVKFKEFIEAIETSLFDSGRWIDF